MFGDIEQLVLSGGLFNGQSRSSSPTRTPSPDIAQWPPGSPSTYDDKKLFGESDNESEPEPAPGEQPQQQQHESIGMGPGRTGVKGVIRDRAEHDARERAARAEQMRARNAQLEKSALLARPYTEDEKSSRTTERFGRFGHLREVGAAGFVGAVEDEARGTWVVVHIYDEGLDRCSRLDSALVDLARRHPQTKFLRARAAALGFASLSNGKSKSKKRTTKIGALDSDSEDEDEGDSEEEDDVDVDMLPTMLVYRDGDLVHNWVRVDWEVKIDDIEELLSKHNIIQTVDRPLVRSDDEDD
ncbi:thioredoxin-like protein [Auricularia subglabra TFB-10046 SS5]|nr:thioredoxin-like protein [Auricularia subglabra TFB-10046 SS5]